MSKAFKSIPAESPEEAFRLIHKLGNEFGMTATDPNRQFEISNGDYSAYYDASEQLVKIEPSHSHITEEQIREFLYNFPVFF